MPLTDMPDLMDRINTLLATAPKARETEELFQSGPSADSLLGAPMPALNAAPRNFADVYGADGQMFVKLSNDAQDPALTSLLLALAKGLDTGAFDIPDGPVQAQRLLRYAYPVV